MVVIVDYGAGNIRSVYNALTLLGADACVSGSESEILSAERIVLPGVGAFDACIRQLRERGLDTLLNEAVLKNRLPFLGICVGLQLLASFGEEGGDNEGLGWIPGTVKKLNVPHGYLLPHVGWNTLALLHPHPVLAGLDGKDFYFTHSYALECSRADDIVGTTDYGIKVTAAVGNANILATQFHPEKSGDSGLKLIENFLSWNPTESAC